jgi:hypothetical protein
LRLLKSQSVKRKPLMISQVRFSQCFHHARKVLFPQRGEEKSLAVTEPLALQQNGFIKARELGRFRTIPYEQVGKCELGYLRLRFIKQQV